MSSLNGTNVAAPIVPFTSTDQYATHKAQYGKGGWRTVDTISERDSIPESRREELMIVAVRADGKTYQLRNGIHNNNWTEYKASSIKSMYFIIPEEPEVGAYPISLSFPYNGTIESIRFTCIDPGTSDSVIRIEKTDTENFSLDQGWTNILTGNITIPVGNRINDDTYTINDFIIRKDDYFRVNFINSGGAKHFSVVINSKI